MTTWCTLGDVATFAAMDVTDDILAQAGAQIDAACQRIYDIDVAEPLATMGVSRIGSRDTYWLRLACAYQAAWIGSQFDLYSRSDVTSQGYREAAVQFTKTGLILSPLAKKALSRVSWMRSRSLHVDSALERSYRFGAAGYGSDGVEDDRGWHDLGPVNV